MTDLAHGAPKTCSRAPEVTHSDAEPVKVTRRQDSGFTRDRPHYKHVPLDA